MTGEKIRLEPQSEVILWSRFCSLLAEICDQHQVPDWKVIQTKYKDRKVVVARRALVHRLIGAFQYWPPKQNELGKIRLNHGEKERGWRQISMPVLAHLFHSDHSTFVCMMKGKFADDRPKIAGS